MAIKHKLDKPALQVLLRSTNGPVAKNMLARGIRVASQAKRNLERPPRRVNTGVLRADIHAQLVVINQLPAVRVGTSKQYAIFVHDGTGIYGPKGTKIVPKTRKALAFYVKNKSGKVIVKSVKGMKPNPFLRDAIKAAKM